MILKHIIWLKKIIEKIQIKHNVSIEEVEEVLMSNAIYNRSKKGNVKGEDVYLAYGTTSSGRYLLVAFIFKKPDTGIIISARTMTAKERRYYNERKR